MNRLSDNGKPGPAVLVGLCGLAVLAYLPAQALPLIADDYDVILLARKYGSMSGWSELLLDPLYRCRAVSNVLTYWIECLFGFSPAAFNAVTLLFHVLNTLLVAALGIWKPIGWRISVPGAAFFAVAEGHQEAVIWFSALPDLNVTTFVLISLLCWIRYLETSSSLAWWGSIAAFVLALFSKESAVALVGLQVLVMAVARSRRVLALVPFVVLSAVYFFAAWSARSEHLHFNDGTFSLHAPFLVTIAVSTARMYWFWGLAAAGALILFHRTKGIWFVATALAAGAAALFPYSFLTYMNRVPSRHTYLASVALAMVIGAAWVALHSRRVRPQLAAAITLCVMVHNVGYIWIRKHGQFLDRAQPTVDLIKAARSTDGQIIVECFPYALTIAESALLLEAGEDPKRLVFRHNPGSNCGHGYRYIVESPGDSTSRRLITSETVAQ